MERERLTEVLSTVEHAQHLLSEVQAYNNVESFQKASLQLMLAKQSISAIDQQQLTKNEQVKLSRAQELLRHLNETKDSIQSL
jgi:hypothetical protein